VPIPADDGWGAPPEVADVSAQPQGPRNRSARSFKEANVRKQEMSLRAALIKSYPSEEGARQAVETLRAAGVLPRRIRLLVGRPLRDARREPLGGFAGPVGPDDTVGTYASRPRPRSHATGSFATGSFTGLPDRREGSFADVERIVILTYEDDAARSRVTGHHGARQLLRGAALDDDAVDRAVKELHIGHAVVLVDAAEIAPTAVRAHLEQVAQAA
jgi:hypothetical protein